jgi:hypothetical protein
MRRVSNAILLVEKAEEENTDIDPTPETPDTPDVEVPDNGETNVPDSGNTTAPGGTDNNVSPFAQFFINIWRAIVNFFKNLFG